MNIRRMVAQADPRCGRYVWWGNCCQLDVRLLEKKPAPRGNLQCALAMALLGAVRR